MCRGSTNAILDAYLLDRYLFWFLEQLACCDVKLISKRKVSFSILAYLFNDLSLKLIYAATYIFFKQVMMYQKQHLYPCKVVMSVYGQQLSSGLLL